MWLHQVLPSHVGGDTVTSQTCMETMLLVDSGLNWTLPHIAAQPSHTGQPLLFPDWLS